MSAEVRLQGVQSEESKGEDTILSIVHRHLPARSRE